MKDFGIYQFNPQPEPPAQLIQQGVRPQTYYRYELENVQVTSYQVFGGG